MDDIDKFIATRIRTLRGELTQDKAAELCRIPKVTFQRAETGPTSLDTLYKIARGFKRPVGWFFGEEAPAPTPQQALSVLADMVEGKSLHQDIDEQRVLAAMKDPKVRKRILTLVKIESEPDDEEELDLASGDHDEEET